jgi:hypothetical protein
VSRSIADVFLRKARWEETTRQRRRKAEEAAELENQENARRQRETPKESFVTIIPRTSSGQRARLWELTDAEPEKEERPQLGRQYQQERQEAQVQSQNNFIAMVTILNGQRAFPSPDSWPAIVENLCFRARIIVAQEKSRRERGATLSLTPLEAEFTRSIVALHERSDTTNIEDLEAWMKGHYKELRTDYFHMLLDDSGSAFSYFAPFY